MFDDRDLEIIYEALHVLLGDLSEEATYSEIREVELVIEKVDQILEEVFPEETDD